MTTQQRYFTDIPLPKKPKILLLVEPQQPGTEDDGMHFVRIPNSGYQVCCNASTNQDCVACGRPTCPAHFSTQTLYVQDREGKGEFALCCQCAQLTREELERIRQLRLSLSR